MYTILLVEDEEAVRHSIKDLTPWEEYGFSVMGEASNGMEALEIISETMPDVIITDIRMPYMDGIQFIQEVREKYSQTVEVIFLSGYDEFTFAQTALSLKAAEYVLKPVSIDSMRALLGRIRAKLDEDVARVSDRTKLEAFYRDAFDVYKEKFLVSLITPTRKKDETLIAEKASEYGVPLKGNIFAVSAHKSVCCIWIAIWTGIPNCLNPRFLIIIQGYCLDAVIWNDKISVLVKLHRYLLIYNKNFVHFLIKIRISFFEIIFYLKRLDVCSLEQFLYIWFCHGS